MSKSNKWFKTEQIETVVGINGDMTPKQIKKCRKKLIVIHQCGDNKEHLIEQLETMIYGLKNGFEYLAS